MKNLAKDVRVLWVVVVTAVFLTGCSMMGDMGMSASGINLTGAEEVPPAATSASGKSTIKIGADKSVSGTVTVSGINATASHIHEGAKGVIGPVIVPLTKTSDNTFTVPANAKLTDSQYACYLAGNLYGNVHSAAYPIGEIRAQLPGK
jgi:hypothetical protein